MSGINESGVHVVRASRLDATGQPVSPGTSGAWALCDPTSVELTFNFDSGEEVIKKDGSSNICFYKKNPDQLKNASVKLGVCANSFKQMELLVNGPGVLLGGATPTGIAFSAVSCGALVQRGGVFLEWYSSRYNCSAQDTESPYSRHVTPRWWANYEGGTWDNGAKDFTFSGESVQSVVSPTGGTSGPFDDITGLTADTPYLYIEQDEAALPECDDDYIATAVGS